MEWEGTSTTCCTVLSPNPLVCCSNQAKASVMDHGQRHQRCPLSVFKCRPRLVISYVWNLGGPNWSAYLNSRLQIFKWGHPGGMGFCLRGMCPLPQLLSPDLFCHSYVCKKTHTNIWPVILPKVLHQGSPMSYPYLPRAEGRPTTAFQWKSSPSLAQVCGRSDWDAVMNCTKFLLIMQLRASNANDCEIPNSWLDDRSHKGPPVHCVSLGLGKSGKLQTKWWCIRLPASENLPLLEQYR